MPRSLTVRKPRTAEIRELNQVLEDELDPRQRRRAEAILLYAAGLNAVEIAQVLEAHLNTIYADLRAFHQQGMNSLRQSRASRSPLGISDALVAEICRLAEQPPYELGLPYGRWTLAKLRHYLIKQRRLKAISREHLRRLLKKGASACAASGARS